MLHGPGVHLHTLHTHLALAGCFMAQVCKLWTLAAAIDRTRPLECFRACFRSCSLTCRQGMTEEIQQSCLAEGEDIQ